MNKQFLLLFAFMALFSINSTYSQGCEGDEPAATGGDTNPEKAILFGYIQPQYDYSFTSPETNTFSFKRARIGVRGTIKNDWGYYFMLETSPFISSTGDAYLMDAFITWKKHNWTKVSLGTFKQPFSLEVATPCHMLTTVDRSIVVDQLVAPQRDFGLMLLGGNKYTKFNYAVALMNGRGLKVKDDNRKKDIVARATYKVADFLAIGASFRYGYPTPNNNEDSRTTFGAEFLFNMSNFKVQGEWIYDEGDYFAGSGGGCGTTPVELGPRREGGYAMITYDTKWKVQPVFKYEYFDPNKEIKKIGYQERMTLGVNYFFNDKIRLQLNYQANIETYINQNNDVLVAQMQVKF